MPIYKAPVDDTLFLLNDVLHLERYGNLNGFSDVAPDRASPRSSARRGKSARSGCSP